MGIACNRQRGQFGRRIGMRQTAADCATITDLVMCDVGDRFDQQRMCIPQLAALFNIAPAHFCANFDAGIVDTNGVQAGNMAQVDQQYCSLQRGKPASVSGFVRHSESSPRRRAGREALSLHRLSAGRHIRAAEFSRSAPAYPPITNSVPFIGTMFRKIASHPCIGLSISFPQLTSFGRPINLLKHCSDYWNAPRTIKQEPNARQYRSPQGSDGSA